MFALCSSRNDESHGRHLALIDEPFMLIASCSGCGSVVYRWWANSTAWTNATDNVLVYHEKLGLAPSEMYTFTVEGTAIVLYYPMRPCQCMMQKPGSGIVTIY